MFGMILSQASYTFMVLSLRSGSLWLFLEKALSLSLVPTLINGLLYNFTQMLDIIKSRGRLTFRVLGQGHCDYF